MPYATVDFSNLQLSFSENCPAELMTDSTEISTQVLTPVDQQDVATLQKKTYCHLLTLKPKRRPSGIKFQSK